MEDTEMGGAKASLWNDVLSRSAKTVLSQTQKAEKQKEREAKEKEQTEKDAESTTTPKKTNNEEETPTNIPGIIDTTSKLLEKHIKITIRPKTPKQNEEVVNSLSQIVAQLMSRFPSHTLELWDNNGTKRSSGRWRTGNKFATQFKFHRGKGNKNTKRLPYYWIVLRICTSESVKGIRLNQQVKSILADKKARMSYTDWTEDSSEDSHITSMAFLIQYDPKNCSSSQAKREITY